MLADRALTRDIAAVIMEKIPATGGLRHPSDDWHTSLRQLCDGAAF
jgi:acetylornithine/succinyldiaminopimelate/putrescine aminotransferase